MDILKLKKVHSNVVAFELVSQQYADEIPGGYVNKFRPELSKYAELPPVLSAYETVLQFYAEHNEKLFVQPEVLRWLKKNADNRRSAGLEATNTDILQYFKTPDLYPHQIQGVQHALSNLHYNNGRMRMLMADDPRLGKSVQALVSLQLISINGPILILCPKALIYQWQTYVDEWVQDAETLVLVGTTQQKLKQWTGYKHTGGHLFVITNWETLHGLKEITAVRWFAVIGDEAHRLKNRNSKVTKLAKHLVSTHFLLLSATFVEHLPDQWWSPLNVVLPEKFSSYWRWVGLYTDFRVGYGVELTKPRNIEWLKDHVAPYVLQRKSDEIVNMPTKLYEDYDCELNEAHKAQYDKLEISLRIELSENTTLSIVNKVALLTRLRQMCLHPLLLDKNDNSDFAIGKFAVLRELLENYIPQDEQVIVYSSFVGACFIAKYAVQDIAPSFIYAGTHNDPVDIEMFQRGQYRLMIATPQKGGVGLNLYNADWVVYLDMPWSTVDIRQSEERVRAIGKTKPVTVVRLSARKTIDQYVNKHVFRKMQYAHDSEIVTSAMEYFNEPRS